MTVEREFSWVMVPTTACNASCLYCFQKRPSAGVLSIPRLEAIFKKMAGFARRHGISRMNFYWQGGEVMVLGRPYLEEMLQLQKENLGRVQVKNSIQSNMLAYDSGWGELVRLHFGGVVGSSIDFPNVYRRTAGGDGARYEKTWRRNVRQAQADGLRVNAIAVPNSETLRVGAQAFLDYYVREARVACLQINLPFPLNGDRRIRAEMRRNFPRLKTFLADLYRRAQDLGGRADFRLDPFQTIVDAFRSPTPWHPPCIFARCCASQFLAIGPGGDCAVCDCWLEDGPDRVLGNLVTQDLEAILQHPFRQGFFERTEAILGKECGSCRFLNMCYGGCPMRAYSFHGDIGRRDFYCGLYKQMFELAGESAG
jgi:uncharacterized protein